jgi:hypothetical protein
MGRAIERLLRRPKQVVEVSGIASMSTMGTAVITATVSGPAIPADALVEEKIRLLIRRVELVEAHATADRTRHNEEIGQLRSDLSTQGSQLRQADEVLRLMAKDIAAGTARLQIVGLILVGLGTAIMALPTLLGL